jgi:hypothetical protein
MLTTDDLRSLAADRIRELRAEAARERLARGFSRVGSGGPGFRRALGRALIAFGLIVEGDGGVSAPRAALPASAGPNPCDDDLVLRRAA